MPPRDGDSPLEAALSFYSSIVVTTAEGDSLVSEDTLEGLGTTGFLLQALFGSLVKISQPSPVDQVPYLPPTSLQLPASASPEQAASAPQAEPSAVFATPVPGPSTAGLRLPAAVTADRVYTDHGDHMAAVEADEDPMQASLAQRGDSQHLDVGPLADAPPSVLSPKAHEVKTLRLTQYLPVPGYFLAGAIAGGVSRTATAPLDRLKVYLLVNTNINPNPSLHAVKHGRPISAVRSAGRPIADAIATLYKSGGIRTFFAGTCLPCTR